MKLYNFMGKNITESDIVAVLMERYRALVETQKRKG